MLSHQLYYRVKPYFPWTWRMALRRRLARRKLAAIGAHWPINPAAGAPPAGWPGWPQGKRFALVLTHDVEGVPGLNKTRPLMRLEQTLGFRSSFNFIPEGDYQVAAELRHELVAQGFEVGVHDLRHDGKLFWNSRDFPARAARINHYLRNWQAAGFRAGFMLHNHDCLAELAMEYDASAVDNDPFEPQPWEVNRIFPFWVPRAGGGGYVELPYTLPQDSTLFLLLRENSPAIWRRKLDWIAAHGGMALLDVHPDYLGFAPGRRGAAEYPAAWYEEFLQYVRDRYAGQYWQPLPRELAAWYKGEYLKTIPEPASGPGHYPALQGQRAAVVLYSYYESDPRPRRETESLQQAGMEVDVICLRKNPQDPWHTRVNGVNVYHVPLRRRRAGKLMYLYQYGAFFIMAFGCLSVWGLRRRYRLVHAHNMPDFLAFCGLVPRLLGARIILDLHDPMPELFQSIYGMTANHPVVRGLKWLERWSIRFAHLVLTPNIAFKKCFTARSCPPEKVQTIMNSPSPRIFDPARFSGRPADPAGRRRFVLMYHGLLVERHGLDLAIRSVAQLRDQIPGLELHLYGEATEYTPVIDALVRELDLGRLVFSHGQQTLEQIAAHISQIDLGLVPNRLSVFTAINFPTRIFEYLALQKPVLVPRTEGIRDYFAADEILYFEPGNVADLAAQIAWAYARQEALQELTRRGRKVFERWRWEHEERRFLTLADRLAGPPATGHR